MMSAQLRTFTVNLKSLDQDISDPIIASAGDAYGRTFRILFDEEAEAQITDETLVYLSWKHQQTNVKGYNVFTKEADDGLIWSIRYPKAMLHKGDVLCCVELVDDISIVCSQNFMVHVLSDPNDGSEFVLSDDYSVFQEAVISMTTLTEKQQALLDESESAYDSWKEEADAGLQEIQERLSNLDDLATTGYVEKRLGEIPEDSNVTEYISALFEYEDYL